VNCPRRGVRVERVPWADAAKQGRSEPFQADSIVICSYQFARNKAIDVQATPWGAGLLQYYYADVAAVLVPHVRDRAMVMKRYPNGAGGKFFFMKRTPSPRPDYPRSSFATRSMR
jgi:hypothetical protein